MSEGGIRTVVRKTLLALAGGLALVLVPASPALAADTTPTVEHVQIKSKMTAKSLETYGQFNLKNLKTGETTSLQAVAPPGGGCRYPVGFNGIASYTNGALTSVTLDYEAQAVCTVTGPDQYMAGMVVTASMWRDGTHLGEGPTVNCVNCVVSPISRGYYACGGVTCAGGYWAGNIHALKAPPGYVWPSAPAGCIGLGTAPYEWIQCSTVTDVAVVSPTN
jgi:hypothetical protein